MVLLNPCLHILVVTSQEKFLFFLEVVAEAAKLLHDFAGLFFRYSPARHEPYTMSVKVVECAGLERAEHFEIFWVSDAL